MALKYRIGASYPSYPYKDPDSNLDYSFDWSSWLGETETILTSTWEINGTDSALVETNSLIVDSSTVVWLNGGTLGVRYIITNHIVTSEGRADDRSAYIKIREL